MPVLKMIMNYITGISVYLWRTERSYMAQYRFGILPIATETGRWTGINEQLRICKVCNSGKIENEIHLLFECTRYNDLR